MSFIRSTDSQCPGWYIIGAGADGAPRQVNVVYAREGLHTAAEWRRFVEVATTVLAWLEWHDGV